jgi:hypothetical protein
VQRVDLEEASLTDESDPLSRYRIKV